MSLTTILQVTISESVNTLFGLSLASTDIVLQPTRKEFEGSHTVVVFPYTKVSKLSPEQTGQKIGEYLLQNNKVIVKFNVVKGFLNLTISDTYWLSVLNTVISTPDYGTLAAKNETVMVEYSSPNTNKPLHLGHLRNNFLGYSVSSILKKAGYDVVMANLINDRGIHICKSMLAYQKFGNNETPESAGLKGDHLVGKYYVAFDKAMKAQNDLLKADGWDEKDIEKKNPLLVEAQEMLLKWEKGDTEVNGLWKTMNAWVYDGFNQTYKNIGVHFDKYYYESDTYLLGKTVVEEGLEKGVFYKKENGAICIDLTAEGLDEKVVLRADGTSVYITQDMGTADLKYAEFKMNKSVYVVGNEQDYHFVVLKHILKRLNKSYSDGIFHLSYGMVDLPSGKMKSREGTVVDADDLIQEMQDTSEAYTKENGKFDDFSDDQLKELCHTIGLGALKYYLLKVDPQKRMMFNPAESIDFKGHTGPFIQYTHARCSAIKRKAETESLLKPLPTVYDLHTTEREVLIKLEEYPAIIAESAAGYSPALVANYVYEVAKLYNSFYTELTIFKEENKEIVNFRATLSISVAQVIKSAMSLLGINVPEKM